MSYSNIDRMEWVLRVAVFGEFLGHGVLAVQGKAQWVGWVGALLHVNTELATTILLAIGVFDVIVACCILCFRNIPRAVLLWAAIWGFWTAILRPIMGESVLDFVERAANWGAPLALLYLRGWPQSLGGWSEGREEKK